MRLFCSSAQAQSLFAKQFLKEWFNNELLISLGTRNGLKHLQRCCGWEVSAQGCGCSLRIRSCPIPHSSQSLQPGAGCGPHHFVSSLM